ncbi:MAG: DoxX family membrane protein [Bacteroidales bacterium]|nr:DoxX family membrane protein [Bacteroidales bacterium]
MAFTIEKQRYSNLQAFLLITLRVLIGWHFLYEGVVKLFDPNWSSEWYLLDSQGFMAVFFHALAGSTKILQTVDFLNIWGLILIGSGLILGIFTRVATISGIVLLSMYYLSHPPFASLTYAMPFEGNYLIVDKNLVEIFALAIVAAFPTGNIAGIDRLLNKIKG